PPMSPPIYAFSPYATLFRSFFDFRNHITTAVNTDRIANAYIQTVNFTNIMQGHIGYRDAAHRHRIQTCHRCQSSGTTHLPVNIFDRGQGCNCRKFIGRGPTRLPAQKTELLLLFQVIDFNHHAIDFYTETGTFLNDLFIDFLHVLNTVTDKVALTYSKTKLTQPFQTVRHAALTMMRYTLRNSISIKSQWP